MPPKDKELINQWIPEGGGGFDVIAVGLQESSYREKPTTSSVVMAAPTDGSSSSPQKPRSSRTTSKATSQDGGDDAADDDDAEDEGDGDDSGDGDTAGQATAEASKAAGDVILKKSGAKRSIRKVSKLVRQVSSNLRDSVVDALDYPFSKQLFLHLGGQYGLVGKVELMEMRLLVYVHARHTVSQCEKHTVATGLGSVIGNKGGLIYKLVVANTSLCFVSCHLAAHQDQKFLDKRNADCASILGSTGVGLKRVQLDCQFDHCFFFGDLNYRVDLNYSHPQPARTHEQHYAQVLALVKAKKWPTLLANDQLRHQIAEKKALLGWELVPPTFAPTFKRERLAAEPTFNPQRVPSYCDRVLYKSLPGWKSNLQCTSFDNVEAIATSDHKPVVAQFTVYTTPHLTTPSDDDGGGTSMLSRTTTVEIRELVATDLLGMDISGKSDPYIKFYSLPEHVLQRDASGSHPTTATIMHTLAPAWQNDQVPKLSLLCESEADARCVHLVLLFMDYDATSADDMLGNVVISLDKFCHGNRMPRFLPFEAPVVRHGKPAGSVSGKLRVMLPHQQALGQATGDGSDDVALRVAGCHCTLS